MSPKQAAACCGPADDLLDPAWFKALCDPSRVLILGCLIKCARPCAVSEIAECCSVDLSVVSRHLKELERAEILEASKDGRTVFYRVRYAEVCQTLRSIADAIEQCCPPKKKSGAVSGGACCANP